MQSRSKSNASNGSKTSRTCPICNSETVEQFFPFCSKHCADLDLNRWLSERYAIPAVEEDLPDEDDEKES